jgi:hypothetical protein
LNGLKCSLCGKELDIRFVTDISLLATIAKTDSIHWDGEAAIEKINDDTVLLDIAKNAVDGGVGEAAVRKLTDQSILTYIAKSGKGFGNSHSDLRYTAISKLKDQSVLASIAKDSSNDGSIREFTINYMTDRIVLAEISNSDDATKYRYNDTIHSYGFEGNDGAQYAVNYEETVIVDLRDVARKRLEKI